MRKLRIVLAASLLTLTLASAPAQADVDTSPVRVNQIGYLSRADKIATIVTAATTPRSWQLRPASGGTAIASGTTSVYGNDRASGDYVHRADFSAVTTAGSYVLWVDGAGQSVPFTISSTALYPDLGKEAMQYFYFHRMGTTVDGQHLQNSGHGHGSLHPGDESVPCYNSWCGSQRLNVRYSWADAGDFGIYAVNHAVSAWTLLNLHERYPNAYADGSLRIPESSNGRPDLLDEVEFGSRWMSGLLPSTGLASHKVHNHVWSAFPLTSVDQENGLARSAMPPSTNATYAVARTNAQLARVLSAYDAGRASQLWNVAKDAWTRAEAQPNVDYPNGTDAEGGGDYGDSKNSDDRYAAAAELYLTALGRSDAAAGGYRSAVTGSPHYREVGQFDWAEVAATGTLSLLSVSNDLPAADLATMRSNARVFADQILSTMNGEGYPVPISGSSAYPWGSNSSITNRMLVLGVVYDASQDLKYLKGMNRSMDYLMGNNAMRLSYVTGYGEFYETDLHDRWAWGKYPGIAYPKGWLSGGPNSELINDPATPTGRPAAKSYAAKNTAPDAWGSKENTINWNAPLVWTATYLTRTSGDLAGGTPPPVDTTPPSVPANLTVTGTTASSVSLSWSPSTDNTAVTGYTVFRGGTQVGTPAGTSFTDTGLTAASAYSYTVRARDAAGNTSASSVAVTATTQSGGGGSGCTAVYRMTGNWGSGFQGEVVVTNNGTVAIAGWTVTLSIASGRSVSNLWNGVLNGSIVTNAPHNGAVAPAGSTTFGFVANGQASGGITVVSCTAR